jgi:chorismate synthase
LGGVVACVCRGVPTGRGEPVFDKFTARLAQAMLSIPATRGFEIGEGFGATLMKGSEHNDPFHAHPDGGIRPVTNHGGGIQGGISNGEPIFFRVAFKPVSTISLPQPTVAFDGTPVVFEAKGRHDPCVLPRAVPIVEAMAALVLADAFLLQQTQRIPRPQSET